MMYIHKHIYISEVKVAQLCPALCDPMDCSPPGSSIHKILQARILEWVAISFPRGFNPSQGWNPGLPDCRWTLYHLSHQGNPNKTDIYYYYYYYFHFTKEKTEFYILYKRLYR